MDLLRETASRSNFCLVLLKSRQIQANSDCYGDNGTDINRSRGRRRSFHF